MLPPGPIRRVAVLGPPGSGKSTLARRLGGLLSVPITHLDALYHGPGWEPRPAADFLADADVAIQPVAWVIDGNYLSHTRERLARADLIVMLDLPLRTTLPR